MEGERRVRGRDVKGGIKNVLRKRSENGLPLPLFREEFNIWEKDKRGIKRKVNKIWMSMKINFSGLIEMVKIFCQISG